ncbi:hypothetical protein G6O69_18095 [Pseudenhygromyxa sp. WMMC2535]|uniref:hypothetical protein n=1 Tax=Pseudenhygromyxa sp. WMMC2535 TaxID=2712867 RepID=UPI001595BE23|nr:hypothetical protein [Pseudenhygromyxa sp. WMMC2535]NVB39761.1 hypothetical protein [Pseudenhygromyxa sp. WMMC2535]
MSQSRHPWIIFPLDFGASVGLTMLDRLQLFHDISVAFDRSANLRTLLPRLTRALHRNIAVVEVEIAELDPRRDAVMIRALCPSTGQRWTRQRSSRFIERQEVSAPEFTEDSVGMPRISLAEVRAQVRVPVGNYGLLSVLLEDPVDELVEDEGLQARLLEALEAGSRKLVWLARTAAQCRRSHRNIGDLQRAIGELERAETPSEPPASAPQVPALDAKPEDTEISVSSDLPSRDLQTLDAAIVECISSALRASAGKIYGEDGAAALLGLKPSTLQSKMRKYNIQRRRFTGT